MGPTASGKSQWALNQAHRVDGSILNIDSVQFYKDLVIGAAAPSLEDKQRVPHYLYSYVEAPREMTAGNFLRDFYQLLETNKDLKWPLFIVGGTGFYIQALEKGMFDLPPGDQELQKKIENELAESGADFLHQELLKADPETKIHINDHYRLVRALEIWRSTNIKPSQFRRTIENKNSLKIPFIKLGFWQKKEEALMRVEARTDEMIKNGIINETKFFLDQGFSDWAPLNSVGYAETKTYLKENYMKEWLTQEINKSTMKLIKKQKTWFKRDSSILWSDGTTEQNQIISNRLDQFLTEIDQTQCSRG